jgi:hypothetical protein
VYPPDGGEATVPSIAKSAKAGPTSGDARGIEVMDFALALALGATTYSAAAYFLLDIGPIRFSPVAVYTTQMLTAAGIVAFTRKIAGVNREK